MREKALPLVIILILSLILFYKPAFISQPLGLDTLGHLSKVSYLKLYPFANWDMSWYSGTLFLKLYPPLFYYLVSIFPNIFLGANFLGFLSVLFTSLGIYSLVKYKTKDESISLICGISYLTVLSISYYWISAGNLPYFFALWTIPFSLYFLEKSIVEKQKKYFVFYSLIFITGILTHVIVGFLIGVLMISRFMFEGINIKNLKRILQYGAIPVLITSFWFIPFIFYSSSSGGYEGYVPKLSQLFGFNDNVAWGFQAGGIGVLAFLFVFSILFIKRYWKNKTILFYLSSILFLGFLLLGGLGNHYPLGVDAVRFVLPFSILTICFLGLVCYSLSLSKNKFFLVVISLILISGLVWNFIIISKNFETLSYYKEDSRYKIFLNIMNNKDFPIKDEFTNYRFGTSKFVFGENLNYFMPNVPQTFGYQDAGMLNAPRYYDMRWHIWLSDDIDEAIYWIDWFGIKYFEVENKDFVGKFKNDSRFREVMNYSIGYDFTLFEYLEPKQIISLVDYANETSFGKEKQFSWERDNPDKIVIKYNSIDEDDVVLFKEFYHKTWKAKDLESSRNIKIKENKLGFMYVNLPIDSKGIIFYQSRIFEDYLGVVLTLLGITLLIIKRKNF
jgi:hypothetical protein